MSIRLNLTSANRVFIVEPQWNPSVESQAISRALRLGQGKSVLVVRYVVEHTIEQVCLSIIEIVSCKMTRNRKCGLNKTGNVKLQRSETQNRGTRPAPDTNDPQSRHWRRYWEGSSLGLNLIVF